jgi:hypothetical protein
MRLKDLIKDEEEPRNYLAEELNDKIQEFLEDKSGVEKVIVE